MLRPTKRLEVLIETRESINAHPTSSSPPLQSWLIGVEAPFGTNSFPERHLLKDCVHAWGSTSICAQSTKKTTLFRLVKAEKCDVCSKKSMCDFRRIQQKISATKSYWCCKFRLLKLQYRPVLWIKWPSNKTPERTEVCVAVKWGSLENEITASRKKGVPGTFIMEIWQHLDSEKTNLPPY